MMNIEVCSKLTKVAYMLTRRQEEKIVSLEQADEEIDAKLTLNTISS